MNDHVRTEARDAKPGKAIHPGDDPVDSAMVEAIIRIGHVMGLKTIAEYVENKAIMQRLSVLGVDYVQGFGMHRPEPLG